MLITLHWEVCRVVFSRTQTLFEFGAVEKGEDTVITGPEILLTFFFSTLPSGMTTLTVALFVLSKSVSPVLSTVIVVVVAALIRPPRLKPALTGSLTSITWFGLTTTPSANPVLKLIVSVEFCSSNKINRPNLLAWFLDVQPNPVIFLWIIPYLFLAVVFSTVSKFGSWLSISK